MPRAARALPVVLALVAAGALGLPGTRASAADTSRAEAAFLEHLDAVNAVGYLESGGATRYRDRDLPTWQAQQASTRRALESELRQLGNESGQDDDDRRAVAAMRRTLAELDAGDSTDAGRARECSDARRRELDEEDLRTALVSCFVEHGNHLRYGGGEIDRGTALQLLHVVDDAAQRKALFEAFGPLWRALDGGNDSPYRRMIGLASAKARREGSEIDAAGRALGVDTPTIERWLMQILDAWRQANPGQPIEPWDFRYLYGRANRELQPHVPVPRLLPVNRRFYADLGADLEALRVVFDLEPRPDKSPLAYSDFLERGRMTNGRWQRARARVVGTYPEGGLFSLNELVHENGHAVHVSAIQTRPAYMDWPDTLFAEAFADVPSWSVYEPAWQRKYLGRATDEDGSLRALFANVVLDVAWSLLELRLLRDPTADPNALWTDITQQYLRIVPHPDVPWWAMRVQLVGNPGYMVNYGLGAVLTAEMRERVSQAIGPFDTGNPQWYPWLSERLLRFGSERDAQSLMRDLLGRRASPDALLRQMQRIASTDASSR
jgi:hypothetical protein